MQLSTRHAADIHTRKQYLLLPILNAKKTARLLIEHGASVNVYDKNLQTPLHRISISRKPDADLLRLLLENGADVHAQDDKGLTPLQIASEKGHHEIAQLLLNHRASIVSNTR